MKTDGSDRTTKGAGAGNDNGGGDKVKTLQQEIAKMAKQFESALPKAITPERMMRIVLTAIRKNPDIALCPIESFFGAVLTALQLGLEINTPLGQCYIIAYNHEITFQMGYQGMLELAYRSNKYKRISAEVVYEGDNFKYQYGINQSLNHLPCGKTENPRFVWALYELVNGGVSFKVWTWESVIKHAKTYSKSFTAKSSPWTGGQETQEGMAKKTLLISLLKYGPKSVEIAQAISADESDIQARLVEDGSHTFVDFEFKNSQIGAPDESLKVPRQQAPNAEKKGEPETVPAGKPKTNQTQNQTQSRAEQPRTEQAPRGQGSRTNGLFNQDEEEAMEELYERQISGSEPPDFS